MTNDQRKEPTDASRIWKHAWIGIAMGAFDKPTDTTIKVHIFVADKGDYYEIAEGLP